MLLPKAETLHLDIRGLLLLFAERLTISLRQHCVHSKAWTLQGVKQRYRKPASVRSPAARALEQRL